MLVDDSAVVRGLISRWVNEDSSMEVVGRFANGLLALSGIAKCSPDVVILDIEMPEMDGMTALPELLKLMPGVKIIMSSTLTRKNAEVSMKALLLGATDYIPKPETNRGVTTSLDFRTELLRKIKAMVPGKAIQTPMPGVSPASPGDTPSLRSFSSVVPRILAIGSSTGGPQALDKLITGYYAGNRQCPRGHHPAYAADIYRYSGGASRTSHEPPGQGRRRWRKDRTRHYLCSARRIPYVVGSDGRCLCPESRGRSGDQLLQAIG